MDKFKKIKQDKEIIEIYKTVERYEDLNGGWAHHNLEHVVNVANLVQVILSKLGYSDEFIEEAKIAAILHDTGATEGKTEHAIRSYNFAKIYLKKNDIFLEHENLVLEAIKFHSAGFDTENIIALTLIFSDKLDIKYTRVAKAGYDIEGMKEMQYIKDIIVDIEDKILKVQFICDDKINKKALEEFYFIDKVFKGIKAFSNKMNLEPLVLFNEDIWVR